MIEMVSFLHSTFGMKELIVTSIIWCVLKGNNLMQFNLQCFLEINVSKNNLGELGVLLIKEI